MTQVYYGTSPSIEFVPGAGTVELKIIKTLNYERRPVHDGPQKIYDEINYECIAYLNPGGLQGGATSYIRQGVAGIPQELPGIFPAVTIKAIENILTTPRRRFVLRVGDETILECPPPGIPMDPKGGPFITHFKVVEIIGVKTMVVHWGVRCYINACHRETNTPAVTLSHRWASEMSVDADSFTTLTHRGHAFFDLGRLKNADRMPADFWDQHAPPLEVGFQRVGVQVCASDYGDELTYCVTDREAPLTRLAKGVTRIEATVSSGTHSYDIRTQFAKTSAYNKQLEESGVSGFLKKIPGVGDIAAKTVTLFASAAAATIPEADALITVKVWGNRRSRKRDLEVVVRDSILDILTEVVPLKAFRAIGGARIRLTWDMTGKYVEGICQFTYPGINYALSALERNKFGFNDEFSWPRTPLSEEIEGVLTDRIADMPPLAGGDTSRGGNRGTWLGQLAAQAIVQACQKQPAPKRNNRYIPAKDEGGY